MTLKEELEILRGEPIEVFDGDPMDIPCIETSDPDKLCKHPVVSVHMITYNHELYIRQAIEGVMMQKTDFEFELVIGEDCSQDKTREICFEYQKKYPEKIRVLWWHENVLKLGGNGRRNRAHCRGEFIAYCEGDDYWIDPLKLQKQVDVMRKNPNVGLVYTNAVDYREERGSYSDWLVNGDVPYGLISGEKYVFWNVYSHAPDQSLTTESYLRTATTLIRSSTLKKAADLYEILSWRLRLGDVPCWLALASCSDVYGLSDKTAVYRLHNRGARVRLGAALWRDNLLTRIYFNKVSLGSQNSDLPPQFTSCWWRTNYSIISCKNVFERIGELFRIFGHSASRQMIIAQDVSDKVIKSYAKYCGVNMVNRRWRMQDRCQLRIGHFVRILLPDIGGFVRILLPAPVKKLWRRIWAHGEYAR